MSKAGETAENRHPAGCRNRNLADKAEEPALVGLGIAAVDVVWAAELDRVEMSQRVARAI